MMAYCNNFVVSVLHNEKTLREQNDQGHRVVRLPFESEYKIRLKSKSKVRALVSVFIDGTEVMNPGSRLILKPGETFDLERFIGSNLNEGSRFKFRSLQQGMADGSIQDPWSPENGKVEVKFYEEKTPSFYTLFGTGGYYHQGNPWGGSGSGVLRSARAFHQGPDITYTSAVNSAGLATNCSTSAQGITGSAQGMLNNEIQANDLGGTVEGSHSDQKFQMSNDWFPTNTIPTTIEIWLKGAVYNPEVVIPSSGLAIRINEKGNHEVYFNGVKLENSHVSINDGKATVKSPNLELTSSFDLIKR